jgi:2'-5' RNA ligase
MASMRLFVAIIPPPEVAAELSRRLRPLRSSPQAATPPGLRWTSPDSWHVTLAFLGEVPEPVLPSSAPAWSALLRPAADARPLVAALADLEAGPWRAADICLVRSHPGGSPPGPPRYAELARWPLGQQASPRREPQP